MGKNVSIDVPGLRPPTVARRPRSPPSNCRSISYPSTSQVSALQLSLDQKAENFRLAEAGCKQHELTAKNRTLALSNDLATGRQLYNRTADAACKTSPPEIQECPRPDGSLLFIFKDPALRNLTASFSAKDTGKLLSLSLLRIAYGQLAIPEERALLQVSAALRVRRSARAVLSGTTQKAGRGASARRGNSFLQLYDVVRINMFCCTTVLWERGTRRRQCMHAWSREVGLITVVIRTATELTRGREGD